jgi:metal-sulfur cluster biosynthetic enzyme
MFTESDILAALRAVLDPELGINIVDLGLVYGVQIDGTRVRLAITMTTPACPLLDYLKGMIREEIGARVPGVENVQIDVVWDPPWDADRMTEAARAQLDQGR